MISKSIKLRRLGLGDLEQVLHIQEIITKTKIGPKKVSYWREQVQNDSNLSLVALDGDRVIGFIISEIMTNSFGLDQSGWIKIIGVHPKHMGTGIGQALITELFKHFKKKKINEIYTAARWDSVDLLSFFKSVGFNRSNFINLYKKLNAKE
ncbi:MAG: GNAT family N-acetyltransferase [Deltaproteobacteria bacterium]|nr:GNAT family N-acetyltransferase [Deltaproteobacteria bacterium]